MPNCKLLNRDVKDCFDRLYHASNNPKEDKENNKSVISFLNDDTIFIEKMDYEKNSFDTCVKKLNYYLDKCDN